MNWKTRGIFQIAYIKSTDILAESTLSHLKHWCHEHRAAHEGKDHEASEALLSDAEELGLLPRCWALGL